MFELDPFLIDDATAPMADALLVQVVSDPARLLWSPRGGGFFVEASKAPGAGFEPVRMQIRDGREVAGFAARVLRIFPAAVRFRWEIGEPGARKVVPAYQEGAHSHFQLLGLLESGTWVVVTARGLAARDLLRAWQDHAAWVRARLRAPDGQPLRPLAALMEVAAGKPRRVGSSMATPFERVVHEEPIRIPRDLTRAAESRWKEVQTWAACWTQPSGGKLRAEPDLALEASRVSDAFPAAPEPVPEALAPKAAPAAAESAPVPPVWMDAPAAAPATPAPEGPSPDEEVGLLFLLTQGSPLALARLRRAFPDLPEDAREAVRELARRKPQAGFWKDVPRAMDLFLAWADLFPLLPRIAPARRRALKERLGLGPAHGEDTEDPTVLAALAALRWLFRPAEAERKDLESLFRDLTGPGQ
jgi:hypothetical protein